MLIAIPSWKSCPQKAKTADRLERLGRAQAAEPLKGRLVVMKARPESLKTAADLAALAEEAATLQGLGAAVIVVHGAPLQAPHFSGRAGRRPLFCGGGPLKKGETQDLRRAVCASWLNAALAEALRAAGLAALGASGSQPGLAELARAGWIVIAAPLQPAAEGGVSPIDEEAFAAELAARLGADRVVSAAPRGAAAEALLG